MASQIDPNTRSPAADTHDNYGRIQNEESVLPPSALIRPPSTGDTMGGGITSHPPSLSTTGGNSPRQRQGHLRRASERVSPFPRALFTALIITGGVKQESRARSLPVPNSDRSPSLSCAAVAVSAGVISGDNPRNAEDDNGAACKWDIVVRAHGDFERETDRSIFIITNSLTLRPTRVLANSCCFNPCAFLQYYSASENGPTRLPLHS